MRFCIQPIASLHIGMIALPREPQTILKTDKRSTVLELSREGKFAAKSSGWDENRFPSGRQVEVAVKNAAHEAKPFGNLPSGIDNRL